MSGAISEAEHLITIHRLATASLPKFHIEKKTRLLSFRSRYRSRDQPTAARGPPGAGAMCFQLIERYAVCGCIYYQHAVDQCPRANQRGHTIEKREVSVGYACAKHSAQGKANNNSNSSTSQWPDSGYSSSGFYAHAHFRS
jgi:hypothetical protein